eukprot:TRINITY_DN2402_c0_g2_i10.p1 TRINITY_DN2402_c0_g2~~TRINITY_DN2402_c0_g2_i10.p1  ORF type:complete len:139 (+),score=25.07 TRINITY_DN2402_c0_g2_i10:52-468(+)
MAVHAFFTNEHFETGDLVYIDPSDSTAHQYDPESQLEVIGAVLVPPQGRAPNGRQWFAINGPVYYLNDFYEWADDLTSNFTNENPSFITFNPLTDQGYVTVITNGTAAVKQRVTTPAPWIKVRTGKRRLVFDSMRMSS